MKHLISVITISLILTGCGGTGSGDSNPVTPSNKTGVMLKSDAERIAAALLNGYNGMLDAQTYPMAQIIGDLSSNSTSNPYDCLSSGTYDLQLNDTDNNGTISAGESSDVTFDNCYGSASAPVNGKIHQDLLNLDAVFSGSTIIAADINRWNAHYTYTDFNRIDLVSQELYRFNGEYTFDYQIQNLGWTLNADTKDLRYTNSQGSVLLKDVSIDSTYDQATDTLTTTLGVGGSIADPLGSITVKYGKITVTNFSTDTPSVTGNLEVSTPSSYLTMAITDDPNSPPVNLYLDTDNDGFVDYIWQYDPAKAQTATLEGSWSVYQNGAPAPNHERVEFTSSTVSYLNDLTENFSGSYVDTSDVSMNSLQITVTSASDPNKVGQTVNCIYQFSVSGSALNLACNDPGVSGYPQDFIPASGVLTLYLVK